MSANTKFEGGMSGNTLTSDPPDPISPGRKDMTPSEQPGIDQLPGNEGEIPLDSDDDAPVEEEMVDVDIDNAEMDGEPNPR